MVTFANEAARNSNLTLYEGSIIGLDQDHDQASNNLSTQVRHFARLDMENFKSGKEVHEIRKEINSLQETLSLDEVITKQIDQEDQEEKFVYKIQERGH